MVDRNGEVSACRSNKKHPPHEQTESPHAPMLFLVCRFHTTMCAPHAAMGWSLPPSEAVADAASCTRGQVSG